MPTELERAEIRYKQQAKRLPNGKWVYGPAAAAARAAAGRGVAGAKDVPAALETTENVSPEPWPESAGAD